MPTLPGITDPGDVNDGDTLDPTRGDNVRADINALAGFLAKEYVLDVDATDVLVSNTTTETTLYTYTLPGNTLGASGNIVRVKLHGILVYDGSAGDSTIKFYYGTSTISVVLITGGRTGTYELWADASLLGRGATNAQTMLMSCFTTNEVRSATSNSVSQDSTGDLDIKITIQLGAATTGCTARHEHTITKLAQS